MIVVYCPRKSDGARLLTTWLQTHGSKTERAWDEEPLTTLTRRDTVVVWGYPLRAKTAAQVLNAKAPMGSKLLELKTFSAAGVPCPAVRVTDPGEPHWYPRVYHHRGGNDLLKPKGGDYFTRHVDTHHEFRVHVFDGRGFRVGIKVPDPTRKVHPTIRTHRAGWVLSYRQADLDAAGPRATAITAACAAVKALQYDFGAVDVGIASNGHPVVFEVNSAPGLEGGTVDRYGQLIQQFAQGEN